MWCRHVRNQLSAYADGELSSSLTRAVAEHLTQCEQCSCEHLRLQELTSLTSAIPMEEAPSSLHAGIMMRLAHARTEPAPRLEARPAGRRALSMIAPWVMGAAVTGATAALALTLTQSPNRKTPGKPQLAREATSGPAASRVEPDAVPGPTAPRVAVAAPPVTKKGVTPAAEGEAREELAEPTFAPESKPSPQAVAATSSPAKATDLRMAQPRTVASGPVKPQPVPAAGTDGKPVVEQRNAEPSTPYPTSVAGMMAATTGEAVGVNMAPGIIAETVGMEREPASRMMAGAGSEGEVLGDDNEGEQSLRMFLEERNRTIPQPPVVMPERGRMRKSL